MVIELVTQSKTRLGDTGCPTHIFKLGENMENKICKTCGLSFVPIAGAKGVYCSKACHHKDQGNISKGIAAQKLEAAIVDYATSPKVCVACGQVLPFVQRHNKFCSRSCSAIHSNTTRTKSVSKEFVEKQRANALANPTGWAKSRIGGKPNRAPREIRTCATCNNPFEILKSNPRFSCSRACARIGGAREGSGRAKTGYYKGIYCGSTYELAFLIWHLDHNRDIKRSINKFPYVFDSKSHTYHPDFEVDGVIYEIKGRVTDVDYVKVASCNAVMICGDNITPYITYVSTTYNLPKDKLWMLYDTKVKKSCDHCGSVFQPKTKKGLYCSQSCSLKANRLLSPRWANSS